MFQIVEGNERLDENKKDLRHAQRIFLVVANLVKLLDGVVGDVTQRAAEKGRDARNRDGLATLEQLFEDFQRLIGNPGLRFAVLDDRDPIAMGLEDAVRPRAQEGIARPALASLHAFEQERIAVALQPLEERERRFQVHQQLLVDRNQIALLGEPGEFFKSRLNHSVNKSVASGFDVRTRRR
jgi:hypothetical protein